MEQAERQKIDAFELWCWRRHLKVPWTARRSNQSILKEISPGCSLEGVMLKLKLQYFGHLILCRPLLLLPPIPPSIRVLSNESTLPMRWPQDWSFSFSIIPSKEHPGLISFRMGWLDLLTVQGTLRSLLQHHSSEASVLSAQPSLWSNSHIHT